ncbi:hypothetical protein GVAV_003561 [Gurleya vavrai]
MSRSYMYENRSKSSQRKQREEAQVELRQSRRDDLLSKKRETKTDFIPNIPHFAEYKQGIFSQNLDDIYRSVYEVRRLLSIERKPPIDDIINSGILPRVAEFLSSACPVYANGDQETISGIRIESAWIITNIASGDSKQTNSVVKLGVVKLLIDILVEGPVSLELIDQCVWALGNIGGDSESCRDLIIGHNGGGKIIEFICKMCNPIDKNIKDNEYIKMIRNCTWLLSNLCRGSNPYPEDNHLIACKDFFNEFVLVNDEEIVNDSIWALSYIADSNETNAEFILNSKTMEKIYNLLYNLCCKFNGLEFDKTEANMANICISPILRLIGNIVTGTDEQTQKLIEMCFKGESILSFLKIIFYKYDKHDKMTRVRKEICWIFSNIAAGTQLQIEKLFELEIQSLLLDAIRYSELLVRTEACYGLSNMMTFIETEKSHFDLLVNLNNIQCLFAYLQLAVNQPEMQSVVLNTFEKMLDAGSIWSKASGKDNLVLDFFSESNLGIIEDLQDNEDTIVNEKAYDIIMKHFGGNDENDRK